MKELTETEAVKLSQSWALRTSDKTLCNFLEKSGIITIVPDPLTERDLFEKALDLDIFYYPGNSGRDKAPVGQLWRVLIEVLDAGVNEQRVQSVPLDSAIHKAMILLREKLE